MTNDNAAPSGPTGPAASIGPAGPAASTAPDASAAPDDGGQHIDQTAAEAGGDSAWVPAPWEPPVAGTELEHLLGALDRQRATFRWKADGLDRTALNVTIGASALTLGGLLKHLAMVEDEKVTVWLTGEPLGEPWTSLGGPPEGDDADGWIFGSAGADSPEQLYELYDGAVWRARAKLAAAAADGGLDQPISLSFGSYGHLSLRRMLFDLLEEYGRHTGHADLLREAIDGRVGEDPPSDWRPPGLREGDEAS